ncbi:MAG TPA: glycerol kinase GlpK [Tepidisphaeraceae bacterium]|nr:glycerol kinase GlpK [Tepidisphaeraceae bacterium]
MARYIAAIDQGTTSTRCILFSREGPVVAAQREHQQIFPRPGWVEHDPEELWRRTEQCIGAALTLANARPQDIAAVGIANQRETVVVWEKKTGKPLCNAIVWQDTRTKDICDELADGYGPDRFREKTGLPLATYFSGPKIRWVLDHVPGARQRAESGDVIVGTIDCWLTWWLTGGPDGGAHVTDVTNASRTLLMNLRTLQWDDELLETIAIPRAMLPRIVPSIDPAAGRFTRAGGPLVEGIPVCGILGDQQAALMGQTCFTPGESKNTYGTGCFMLLNTGPQPVVSRCGLLTTVAYQIAGEAPVYALEGSIAVAGSLVQWLRDNMGLIQRSPDVEALARTVEDNGGVYFVPAFSGLFAPYWRSDARGVIAGMTAYMKQGHLARAVLEATAYQTRDVLDAMRQDSGIQLTSLRVDGGMAVNDLLMQFQADVLGVPVVKPKVTETTAVGAAYAAGLAVGFWKDFDDLRSQWKQDKVWEPKMDVGRREELYRMWRKAVERSFKWVD